MQGFCRLFEHVGTLFCQFSAVSVHEKPQKRADFEDCKISVAKNQPFNGRFLACVCVQNVNNLTPV
jgi:hypothetical protein